MMNSKLPSSNSRNRFFLLGSLLSLLIAPDLAKAQSLNLIVTAGSVNVPMVTPQHYRDGNSVTVPAALAITATSRWSLSARVTGPFTFNAYSIPENGFGIDVITPVGSVVPEILFSTADQVIVRNASPTFLLNGLGPPQLLDLTFRTTGGPIFMGKPPGNYSSTIVYTLTAE